MILQLKDVDAGYGFLQVLRKVSLHVDKGEYVCLIGPNGAGKSTLLRTIFGIISPSSGEVIFNGNLISGMKAHKISNFGVAYVSEEMNLFVNMTVQENLTAGAYSIKDNAKIKDRLEFVYDCFPRLAERKKQLAGHMSGGERKMLAISRGLMSYPQLLLVDEPSFGLSPQVSEDVFRALQGLNNDGLTILLVEQNVVKTLAVTNRAYVLENGQVIMSGPSAKLACDEHIRKVFLGR